MADISRRRLLGSAAGVTGAAIASSALPPNLRRALAQTPDRPGSLRDIEHVVILMQENRSFDHYFGTMHGVHGFDDPDAITLPNGKSIFYQPDAENPDGYLLPFHLDTRHTSAQAIPSTSHAWAVQHSAWNGGKMDNWLPAHRKADGDANGPYTMGYYTRADIPFQFALAEAFTICDQYHCSLLGPTWPNRLYHMSATIDPGGKYGGPITSNVIPSPYRWTTYPERLSKAGVSWHVYQEETDYGTNVLEFFKAYQDADTRSPLYKHGLTISTPDQFERDAMRGKLPTVSWIIPTAQQCEHPNYLPASGADFVARKIEAVAANPELWAKTVFILNYDENDGLFDHVPPPVPPAGTADEFVDGLPIGGGIRVPCIIVSPWTQGGFVSSEPFDHTSVLRFLELITGVREKNITAWRRKTFGDLTSALGFPSHRHAPPLPATKSQLWRAEYEVAHFPLPPIPGADQTPPHQDAHKTVAIAGAAAPAAAGVISTPMSGTRPGDGGANRLRNTTTINRADFPASQVKKTVFPGIPLATRGNAAGTSGRRVYMTSTDFYSITVIDAASRKIVASLDAGDSPYGIAVTPDGKKIYVTNAGSTNVSILDPSTNTFSEDTITVGLYPHGIAMTPDGKTAWVANTGPDTGPGGSTTLSLIDTASDKVAHTIHVGVAPQAIAIPRNGRHAFVTCHDGVWVVDTARRRAVTHISGLDRAHGLTVSPDGRQVWVADSSRNRVTVIDAARYRVVGHVPVGNLPWDVAFSPDGSRAYVTNANSDTVSVVDTAHRRVTRTVSVGHIPTGILAGDDDAWVVNNTSSDVSVIDVATLTVTATVENGLASEPSTLVMVS